MCNLVLPAGMDLNKLHTVTISLNQMYDRSKPLVSYYTNTTEKNVWCVLKFRLHDHVLYMHTNCEGI